MKVAFLSPSLSRIAGGIFEIERELALALDTIPDVAVTAYGVTDIETVNDIPAWRQIPLHLGALKGPHGFGYSPQLRNIMASADDDVLHLHAMWMYTSVLARKWKRRTGRSYVTTANGMLEPWARNNAVLKKRAAAFFYERAALRDVGCLHVNTLAELESARAFGVKGPFCVVPNGVTMPDSAANPMAAAPETVRVAKMRGAKVLLFLGRLHPKKNLAATLQAFVTLAPAYPDWHFVAAGWGDEEYRATLVAIMAEANLQDRVHFTGGVFAETKGALLAAADAYVLASHSEGFPMAVLEAFANGLPVAMTEMCNLQVGFDADAAVKVGVTADEIAVGLRALFDMSVGERRTMGSKGRALVEKRYTWDRIAAEMHEVYGWLLGGGAVPDSVVLQ